MTFITPKTWAVGEVLSAVDMNVYVRDNSNALNFGFRYVDRRIFATPGSFTFSKADPMGDGSVDGSVIRAYRVICVGGGGAGGGGKATGAGQCSPAAGGSSGSYAETFALSSAFLATEPVVVGAPGSPAAGATGGNGTGSVFGIALIVSAPGGLGGEVRAAVLSPPSTVQSTTFPFADPIGQITSSGDMGHGALCILVGGTGNSHGGNGGSGRYGSGGSGRNSTSGPTFSDARGFGGGGGGRSVAEENSSAAVGGNATGGLVIVELYA